MKKNNSMSWMFVVIVLAFLVWLVLMVLITPVSGAAEPTPTLGAYPGPEATATPGYHKAPSVPFKKPYLAEPGPEKELWSWVWVLGSSSFD